MLKLLVFSYLKLFDHTNHVRRNVQFSLVNLKFLVSLCLFLNNIFESHGKSHEPILWSIQNEMFKLTNFNENFVDNTLEVRLGEFLNIICPHMSSSSSSPENEYHTLYKVSKEEYDECSIKNYDSVKTILKCDKPNENLKYTLYISTFSPVPDALEFTPGRSYYFISTSDGSLNGLSNLNGGSCKYHNMKFIIKVLDTSTNSQFTKKTSNQNTIKNSSSLKTKYPKQPIPITSTPHSTNYISNPSSTPSHSSNPSVLTSYFYKASANLAENTKKSTKTVISNNNQNKIDKNENDIFLLEPDSIDYGDLLSQFMSISNNSEKNKNLKKYFNNNNNSSSLKEYELTNSSGRTTILLTSFVGNVFFILNLIISIYCYYFLN